MCNTLVFNYYYYYFYNMKKEEIKPDLVSIKVTRECRRLLNAIAGIEAKEQYVVSEELAKYRAKKYNLK